MKHKFKIGDKFTWVVRLSDKIISHIAEIVYIDSERFKYKYIKHPINSEIGAIYTRAFDNDVHIYIFKTNCPEYLKNYEKQNENR